MDVQLKADLSTSNPDDVAVVAARGDYMSDSVIDEDAESVMAGQDKSKKEFIEYLMKVGHFGPLEHAQAVIAFEDVSVVVERQMTRHRHLSYDIQSLRYVEVGTDTVEDQIVTPHALREGTTVSREKGAVELDEADREYHSTAQEVLAENAFEAYQAMIANGVPKDEARYVLPMGTAINGTVSGNLRAMMHVLDLRDAGNVQPETRELAQAISDVLHDWAPLTMEAYEEHAKGASKKAP